MIFEKMDCDLVTLIDSYPCGLPEKQAVPVIKQILEGVSYLHDQNIIHRDLKPDNILCKKQEDGCLRVVIADFGFSIRATGDIRDSPGKFLSTIYL